LLAALTLFRHPQIKRKASKTALTEVNFCKGRANYTATTPEVKMGEETNFAFFSLQSLVRAEGRRQRAEGRGQKKEAEGRGQKVEEGGRGQRAEGRK
jgi:hypothetical protein